MLQDKNFPNKFKILKKLATQKDISLAELSYKLLQSALEDLALSEIAKNRDKDGAARLSHKNAW